MTIAKDVTELSSDDGPDISPLGVAAQNYAKQGYYVFPLYEFNPAKGKCSCTKGEKCPAPGKHPRPREGFKSSTLSLKRIASWWATWPNANIGINCGRSGIAVLDCDPKNGGEASLHSLLAETPSVAHAPSVQTGSGGSHRYFKLTNGAKTSQNRLPGIDVRADGGYVVAPPSLHSSGNRYAGEPPAVDALPDWPSVLTEMLKKPDKAASGSSPKGEQTAELLPGNRIPVGARNESLMSDAGQLVYAGIEPLRAFAMLCGVRDRLMDDTASFSDEEVQRVVDSAYRYESTLRNFYRYTRHWQASSATPDEKALLGAILIDQGDGIPMPSLARLEKQSGLKGKRFFKTRKAVVAKGLLRMVRGENQYVPATYSFPPVTAGVKTTPANASNTKSAGVKTTPIYKTSIAREAHSTDQHEIAPAHNGHGATILTFPEQHNASPDTSKPEAA